MSQNWNLEKLRQEELLRDAFRREAYVRALAASSAGTMMPAAHPFHAHDPRLAVDPRLISYNVGLLQSGLRPPSAAQPMATPIIVGVDHHKNRVTNEAHRQHYALQQAALGNFSLARSSALGFPINQRREGGLENSMASGPLIHPMVNFRHPLGGNLGSSGVPGLAIPDPALSLGGLPPVLTAASRTAERSSPRNLSSKKKTTSAGEATGEVESSTHREKDQAASKRAYRQGDRRYRAKRSRDRDDVASPPRDRYLSGDSSDPEETSVSAGETATANPERGRGKNHKTWLAFYNELVEYHRACGDCLVPRGYLASPKLASWVAEQRKQYKLRIDGKRNSITPERIDLLNKLEFSWNAQQAAWERQYSALRQHLTEHGHVLVNSNLPAYKKLGLWVKEQRRHYSLMKQGRPCHMNEERTRALNAIGFCWDSHEAAWNEHLAALKLFKKEHGHCNVPSCPTKLGAWCQHQRRLYKSFIEGLPSSISEERIRALEDLGFSWDPGAGRRRRSYSRKNSGSSSKKSRLASDTASNSPGPKRKHQKNDHNSK